jgi:hypothetical protein
MRVSALSYPRQQKNHLPRIPQNRLGRTPVDTEWTRTNDHDTGHHLRHADANGGGTRCASDVPLLTISQSAILLNAEPATLLA